MKQTGRLITQLPREKLLLEGPQQLSDAELLAIFLQTGVKGCDVLRLSQQLIDAFGSLAQFLNAGKTRLCNAKGIGQAKYAKLQAVKEMLRRYYAEELRHQSLFENVNQTRQFLHCQMRDEQNEVFAVLFLNSQHHLMTFKKLFFGTINSASVYPRVIIKEALECNAAALILVHNHPSGVAEPSQADKMITRRIANAAALVDITVLDHFVVGAGYSVSFAERGLL